MYSFQKKVSLISEMPTLVRQLDGTDAMVFEIVCKVWLILNALRWVLKCVQGWEHKTELRSSQSLKSGTMMFK